LCQNDRTFLSEIITEDETWIYGYDLETKQAFLLMEKSFIFTLREGQAGLLDYQEHVDRVLWY